ncbi:cytochrome c biogenesis protein ResB [Bacillus horti]|uniref:Cytochrome c biogenesis protein n=1 Tax=Caldalkalibacillus horti TaxID=77523 RepID=A0ABT9VVB0_9BACI|nr:cytochrome c biogenesis protein ResB [Bacillus horti]MDQ0164565.1 cytochrome c biogenesis protein [Bacillus horti]
MLEQIKCECGHANPPGTEICESCGKPFGEDSKNLLNMRYEGAARRSQTHRKSIVDHVWNFFSSVKVAIWLLLLTLIASIFGTIFPQQFYIPPNADPWQFYPDEYGTLGYLYVVLGLHNTYSSWWYVSLLVMIGISLVICSIDRVVPLYRALKKQRVTRHLSFLSRQRMHGKQKVTDPEDVLQKAKKALQERKFTVREEEHAVMGEKGRFSRWGPYVNHVGLIIFLIGVLMRILPGFTLDSYVWVRDGQTVPLNDAPGFYVKSEGFYLELYDDENLPGIDQFLEEQRMVPREFRTEAILYQATVDPSTGEETLTEVAQHTILVNDPLTFGSLKLFQSDYRINEFSEFTFNLQHKETEELLGEVQIDLNNPQATYPIKDGYEVELREYYPNFDLDSNNEPTTLNELPNNPAFIFMIKTPENPTGERSWVFLGRTVEDPNNPNEYELKLSGVKLDSVSGLMVMKDVTLPILMVGGMIFMIGLTMGFYWNHRRIWIQKEGQEIWISAHTNKNWFGIQKDVSHVIEQTGLDLDVEELDKEALESDELRTH